MFKNFTTGFYQRHGYRIAAAGLPMGLFSSRPAGAESRDIIMKKIPRTGEAVPAIGLAHT